jgi:hypothetical protein
VNGCERLRGKAAFVSPIKFAATVTGFVRINKTCGDPDMRIKDFFHDNPPDNMGKVLVIYPGASPETLAALCSVNEQNSIFLNHHLRQQSNYIEGYLNAIRSVVKSYQGQITEPVDDDTAYPILFLARHAIELSLKYCLTNISTHFKACKILPKDAKNAKNTDLQCLNQHLLMPILSAIIELRSFSSHHKSTRLNSLCEDLTEFDNIDPEATAFRYDYTKKQNQQRLHDCQRWVEIDKLGNWATEICNQICAEAISEDIDLCSSGFYSEDAVSSISRMVAALQSVNAWFSRNDSHLPINRSDDYHDTPCELNVEMAISKARTSRELTRKFMATVDKDTLKNATLGYYTARNGCLMTVRSCMAQFGAEQISEEHLRDILKHKGNDLSNELVKLEDILAKLRK